MVDGSPTNRQASIQPTLPDAIYHKSFNLFPYPAVAGRKTSGKVKGLVCIYPGNLEKRFRHLRKKTSRCFFIFCTKDFCFCKKTKRIVCLALSVYVIGSSVNCHKFSISSHRMSLETIFFITSRSDK